MEWLIAIGSLGLGGVFTAIGTKYMDRNKTSAEIDSLAVATADKLVGMLNQRLDAMQEEIDENKEERLLWQRYMQYIHDRLEALAIVLPTFEEWKEDNAEATRG